MWVQRYILLYQKHIKMSDTNIVNIFYVEDNPGEVELISLYLKRYKFKPQLLLHIAETVDEAIESFHADKYAMALIDWNLPDGVGSDVAEHIRKENDSFPILFLSGTVTQDLINKSEAYKPLAFLEKDYSKNFIKEIYTALAKNSNK